MICEFRVPNSNRAVGRRRVAQSHAARLSRSCVVRLSRVVAELMCGIGIVWLIEWVLLAKCGLHCVVRLSHVVAE